ncbi:efflux RND transporter periplasmic adaptor subunit [Vibrio rhizosphaerae]|uniref:Efflux RND transporter periplasmic adaptor subunit n=1 Tax=Vibrio rhizosphaerae TaxID=398736 RepID=A0ABU4IX74_9VIBR|nr:efflux RND transporter periplasmic adaptor subunit [Vibrio rhizosphaerae]MDW6093884.1 efflux RND transporter periplasmic adaptor subunit [Vibrio rhizosphaerae]
MLFPAVPLFAKHSSWRVHDLLAALAKHDCLLAKHVWCIRRGIGLMMIACLSGCDTAPQTTQSPSARPVKTLVVKAVEMTPTITQVGDIQAYQQTSLSFRVSGRILERRVDVGAHVRQGDVLATLDTSSAQNALKQARAEQDSARAAEQLARDNFARMEALLPKGAISRALYDQSRSDWQAAKSRLDNALAAVADAQDNMQFTQLKAPQDGVISETSANQGQVVQAGQQILKLADNHRLDAVFEVPEQVLQTEIDHPRISVALLSDLTIKTAAQLRDITPQADPYTRTYRVRVTLTNPPPQMNLGAIVKGQLSLATTQQLVIPKSALTRVGDQPAVYVVDPILKTKTLRLQPIQVAQFSDTSIQVSAGLNPGERIVVAGVDKLRPGQSVTLMAGEE